MFEELRVDVEDEPTRKPERPRKGMAVPQTDDAGAHLLVRARLLWSPRRRTGAISR
jgi:hypothetical protein